MVQRIVHLLFTYLPPNLIAESAQLRVMQASKCAIRSRYRDPRSLVNVARGGCIHGIFSERPAGRAPRPDFARLRRFVISSVTGWVLLLNLRKRMSSGRWGKSRAFSVWPAKIRSEFHAALFSQ